MELIKPFQGIYSMYERIKKNDQQCPHVLERLKALEKLANFILQKESEKISDDLNEALGKLNKVLLSADELIRKFTESFEVTRAMKSSDYKSEFETLNKSLTDAFVTLSAALHAQQRNMLDKQGTRLSEQENMLSEQKVMLKWQKKKMAETGRKLAEQDRKMAEQDRKFAEQERKLGKQEDMLQKVETKLASESRGNCPIL